MRIRTAADTDRPAIVELVGHIFPAGRPHRAQVEHSLAHPDIDAELLLVAQDEARIVGVSLATTRGHLALIAVDEASRRRGVGSALLRRTADRLLGLGATRLVTRYGELSLLPGVPQGPAVAFFESRGFALGSRECTMRASLPGFAAAEAARGRSEPAGIAIEAFAPEQLAGLRRLIARELEPLWVATLEQKLADPNRKAEDVWVAARGEQLLGFCIVTVAEPSYLGPLGVAVAERRLGIGRAMAARALASLERRGASAVELWTDADSFQSRRLYPPLGFAITDVWLNFECELACLVG